MMNDASGVTRPTIEEIHQEIKRRKFQQQYRKTLRGIFYSLAVVSAVVVLIATLWMPVLRITGASMKPTLNDGEVVIAVKTGRFKPGDVVAFYYNNKILVKRVIATAGQYVDMQDDGTVLVDGAALEEPYIKEKSKGECNLEFPYQVGDGRIFVMGDDRAVSIDSRSTSVGTISDEKILGRVLFKVWPLSSVGKIK